MASGTETFEVRLQKNPFCVATGPHDAGIFYPGEVEAFAPVIIDSPVVFHLYVPLLFSGKVLKLHAEHLGHFLALREMPKIDRATETLLFQRLCQLFDKERVSALYRETNVGLPSQDGATAGEDFECGQRMSYCDDESCETPYVFTDFKKEDAKKIAALLRGLLALFEPADMMADIPYEPDVELKHMIFLYLVQLLVLVVSNQMTTVDLATVMSAASSVFLELNFSHPLCAATVLKPMFVPCYETQIGRHINRTGGKQAAECEPRVSCYRLFTGYELDDKGEDASGDDDMAWTMRSLKDRAQIQALEERKTRRLWFVAPQLGDRLQLLSRSAQQLLGAQTDEKTVKITEALLWDNVMAYMQSCVIGTLYNMLPCIANSELDERVLAKIGSCMCTLSELVRHQSQNLLAELDRIKDTCLTVTGVGFLGQDSGAFLRFGRVFTGCEEKKKPVSQMPFGTFTSVCLGVTQSSMLNDMIRLAYGDQINAATGSVHSKLTTPYKDAPKVKYSITDVNMYWRYHHRFNTGEFTEVGRVKPMSDTANVNLGIEDTLTPSSKYQLIVAHGALPLCGLTMALTMRQTMILVTGFLCAEIARCIYGLKSTDLTSVCKAITGIGMCCKFRKPKKDEEKINTLTNPFGEIVKLTAAMFNNSSVRGNDLDKLEWLDSSDYALPDYLRTSLNMLGDTKQLVERITTDKGLAYNRVVFFARNRIITMAHLYANATAMIHAPLSVKCTMRIFTNTQKSYAGCKLSLTVRQYPVVLFSNGCVKTHMYHRDASAEVQCAPQSKRCTIDEILASVQKEVSLALPRIDINRVRMLAYELPANDINELLRALEDKGVEVTGLAETSRVPLTAHVSESADNTRRGPLKRKTVYNDAEAGPSATRTRVKDKDDDMGESTGKATVPLRREHGDTSLSIVYDSDVDFGFDDSD